MANRVQVIFWDRPASSVIERIVDTETQRLCDSWPAARVRRVALHDERPGVGRRGPVRVQVEVSAVERDGEWRRSLEVRHTSAATAIRDAFAAAQQAFEARY